MARRAASRGGFGAGLPHDGFLPVERVNLIEKRPETASRLKELLHRWEEQVKPSR